MNELYARVYASLYGMEFIGLRYFNIFGPRQDPNGPYAAVIPLFARALLANQPPVINGDGSHSRDFTFVDNAVQANLLALFTTNPEAINQVYNIACGERLHSSDYMSNSGRKPEASYSRCMVPTTREISNTAWRIYRKQRLLGYSPAVSVAEGLRFTFQWYRGQSGS